MCYSAVSVDFLRSVNQRIWRNGGWVAKPNLMMEPELNKSRQTTISHISPVNHFWAVEFGKVSVPWLLMARNISTKTLLYSPAIVPRRLRAYQVCIRKDNFHIPDTTPASEGRREALEDSYLEYFLVVVTDSASNFGHVLQGDIHVDM